MISMVLGHTAKGIRWVIRIHRVLFFHTSKWDFMKSIGRGVLVLLVMGGLACNDDPEPGETIVLTNAVRAPSPEIGATNVELRRAQVVFVQVRWRLNDELGVGVRRGA